MFVMRGVDGRDEWGCGRSCGGYEQEHEHGKEGAEAAER